MKRTLASILIVLALIFTGTPTVTSDNEITPEKAFSSIEDCLIVVWTFDSAQQVWQVYTPDPSTPWVTDLDFVAYGEAYWIKVSKDCNLIYGSFSRGLLNGWNLIAWPG